MKFSKGFETLRFITLVFPLLLIVGVLIILFGWYWSFPFSVTLPILVIINVIQLLFFLIKREKYIILNVVALLLFFFFFDSFYQFNFNVNELNEENAFTIMTYNAHWFSTNAARDDIEDKKIVDFIKDNNADVVCFQEFSAVKYHLLKKDYPYWVKTNLMIPTQKSVLAVFSKYPIVNEGYVEFFDSTNNTMYVDIDFNGKIVRIYNVHLESNRSDAMYAPNNKNLYSSLITSVLKAEQKRIEQAQLIKKHLKGFDGNVIIAGDFNCTQYAPAYLDLKDARKDTFVEAGNGFGGTYELFGYPFKIDHILVDSAFDVIQHKNYDTNLSDHEPVMAAIKFKD